MAGERQRLAYQPALDGLRALAVLAVVAYHGGVPFFDGGSIGVDVFFVLSGFLITTLMIRERRSTERIDLRSFWARRVRRLAPSLLVVGVAVLIVYGLDHGAEDRPQTLVGVPTAWAYITSWVRAFQLWETGQMDHAWSLSVEEFFYLLFPVAVVGALALGLRRRSMYLAVAASVGYTLLAANVLEWSDARLYFAPDTRAQQLLIGCGLALLLERGVRPVPVWFARVLFVGAVAVLMWWMVIAGADTAYYQWGMTVVAVCAAIVVWFLVTHRGWAVSVLSLGALVWIGRRSYTIYLVHFPLFGLIAVSTLVNFVVVLGASLLWAGISYRLIEQRFLRRPAAAPNPA